MANLGGVSIGVGFLALGSLIGAAGYTFLVSTLFGSAITAFAIGGLIFLLGAGVVIKSV